MEMVRYRDILKDNGLEWDFKSMKSSDVSNLEAKCVFALIIGAERVDRFSEGTLLVSL